MFPGYFLTLKAIGFSDTVTFLVQSSVLCIMDITMLGSSLSSAGTRELVTLNECGRVACTMCESRKDLTPSRHEDYLGLTLLAVFPLHSTFSPSTLTLEVSPQFAGITLG